jgi:hypothetical protein
MTEEQLETIVSLFCGLETAVAHLATVFESKGVASRTEVAQSFRATAMGIPQNVKSGPIITFVLNRVASTIEHSTELSQKENEIRHLLH